MQFTYQFPERCNGLVLVCSGGLGTETPKWLRAATLPGSRIVFAAIGGEKTTNSLLWGCRQLARVGIEPQLVNPQMVEKLSGSEIPTLVKPSSRRCAVSSMSVASESPRSANLHRWKTFQSC